MAEPIKDRSVTVGQSCEFERTHQVRTPHAVEAISSRHGMATSAMRTLVPI